MPYLSQFFNQFFYLLGFLLVAYKCRIFCMNDNQICCTDGCYQVLFIVHDNTRAGIYSIMHTQNNISQIVLFIPAFQ